MEVLNYRVNQAEFVMSCPKVSNLPERDVPEVAFIGRSNVGKSSLINAICQRTNLARTSKTPGRTQAFNFFRIDFAVIQESGEMIAAKKKFSGHLVDLPGYGYAKVGEKMRAKWPQQIEDYILRREQLAALLLLIDIRREPGDEERWVCEVGQNGNLIVVMTKSDQVTNNEYAKRRHHLLKELKLQDHQLVATALVGKNRRGVDDLRNTICGYLTGI